MNRFWFFPSCMMVLMVITMAQRSDSQEKSTMKDWILHKDPLGFSVRHPADWQVKTMPDSAIRIVNKDNHVFVIVLPFVLKQSQSAQECIQNLSTIFPQDFSGSKIEKYEQIRPKPDEGVARLSFGEAKSGTAHVLCSIDGSSGMLYIQAAPKERFSDHKATLMAIVKSFSFIQASEAASPKAADADSTYIRWTDPRENAFSLEMPQGWTINGGLFRFASVDVRTCVELLSPDGKIRITGGDTEVPTFSLPMSPLFPEGSWYSPGYGVNMMVMHYLPGLEFAKEYVKKKTEGTYTNLKFSDTRDCSDVAQTINALNAQYPALGISTQTSVGEVAFTCQKEQKDFCGYYFSGTTQVTYTTGFSTGGIWHVPYLYGFIATNDQAPLAQAVLDHAVQSVKMNPQWFAMQQGITSETSKIVSRTNDAISNTISESYWNRQSSQDNSSRNWSNMMLGQTDLVDPDTGETFKRSSGHNYYWRKEYSDTIVGTNTYDRPDIDFTPLQEW